MDLLEIDEKEIIEFKKSLNIIHKCQNKAGETSEEKVRLTYDKESKKVSKVLRQIFSRLSFIVNMFTMTIS